MLNMSAKTIMSVAEKLYTKGFISYPRTETNIFAKSIDLAPLVANQASDNRFGSFVSQLQGGLLPCSFISVSNYSLSFLVYYVFFVRRLDSQILT